VLATIVMTDIVDSTARAAELGDVAWGRSLERHHMALAGPGEVLVSDTTRGLIESRELPLVDRGRHASRASARNG